MGNRIISLMIATPVTSTLFIAVLYKISPDMPIWAGATCVGLILVIIERVGYIYDHFKTQKA